MDIFAHALWAGAGANALSRRFPLTGRSLAGIVAFAAAPDLVPMLPVLGYAFEQPSVLQFAWAYATATPGAEPMLPSSVKWMTHHLHCAMHSVVVVAAVTVIAGWWRRAFPVAMLGWWSHVLLDIPTHSADFYAVPLFYPISERAFDGVAWNRPWVLAANYAVLAIVYALIVALEFRRRRTVTTDPLR